LFLLFPFRSFSGVYLERKGTSLSKEVFPPKKVPYEPRVRQKPRAKSSLPCHPCQWNRVFFMMLLWATCWVYNATYWLSDRTLSGKCQSSKLPIQALLHFQQRVELPDSVSAEKFPLPTPLKTNMDTQNDGLEKVSPFKYGNFWYLC